MNELQRRKLLRWFDSSRRPLPWRGERDPYRILVSEIMLQQTTAGAVVPAYGRFLEAFPTLASLAAAAEDDVLAAWSGLGYYRRARALQGAARRIHEAGWPRTADGLRKLPGIGPYTAAAVASIAFGEAVPVLDGNVVRVMSRYGEVAGDPSRAPVRQRLLGLAGAFVDPRRPGDSNQALMELGATLCRPADPSCGPCPLRDACGARRRGSQAAFPTPKRRPVPVRELFEVYVVRDARGRYLVERRSGKGALQGLWEFPTVGPLEEEPPGAPARRGRRRRARLVATEAHAIMNRRLTLLIYEAGSAPRSSGSERRFATPEEIGRLPRSSIVDKVLKKTDRAAESGRSPRGTTGKARRP
jgi:A/G-specific adenine glycosylase